MGLKSVLIGIKKLSREAIVSIVGRILAIATVLASTKLLANMLGPAEYGRMAVFNTCSLLSSQFLFGPIGQGLLRYFSVARDNGQYKLYEKTAVSLIKKAIIPSLLLTIATGFFVLDGSGWAKISIILVIGFIGILDGLNGMCYGIHNGARNRVLSATLEISDRVLKLLIIGLILWAFAGTAEFVFVAYLAGGILMLFMNVYFYKSNIQQSLEGHATQPVEVDFEVAIKKYSWPFMIFGIFGWIQFSSDRWALQYFRTDTEIGQYSMLFQTGFQTINVAYGVILGFVTPILFDKTTVNAATKKVSYSSNIVKKILLFTLIFTGFGSAFCFVFHKWIICLLASSAFTDYSWLLPWVVIAGGLFASGQVVAMNFMATLTPQKLIIPKMLLGLSNLVFCFIGAKFWGIPGVVGGLVLANLIYLISILIIDPARKQTQSEPIQSEIPSSSL